MPTQIRRALFNWIASIHKKVICLTGDLLAGAVTIFQYGAGPNGVMRTLGKYMLGSGATFGYVRCNRLAIHSNQYFLMDCTGQLGCETGMAYGLIIFLHVECSCPSEASSEPKAPTTRPGVASRQTQSFFLATPRDDDKRHIPRREGITRVQDGIGHDCILLIYGKT